MTVGGVVFGEGDLVGNIGRDSVRLRVTNTLDRAVQVTSHYHFFEANRGLKFHRRAAYGMRLDVPAGTGVRFEPGESSEVALVAIGGARRVVGFQGLVNGELDDPSVREAAMQRATKRGFSLEEEL